MRQQVSYLSNIFFLVRRVHKLHMKSIWIKTALKSMAVVQVFLPLFFVREILDAVQKSSSLSRVLALAGAFAGSILLCGMLKELFARIDERESDTVSRLVRKDIAESIARLPYYKAETAQARDFIQLVQDSVDISQLFDTIASFFQGLVTLVGLVVVVATLHPLFLMLLASALLARIFADRGIRQLWEEWRGPVNVAYRKVNYMLSVMREVQFGKEIRVNRLQRWFLEKMDENIGGYIGEMRRYNVALQRRNALAEGAALIQEGIVYLVLAYKAVWEHMPIGDYSMYLSGIIRLSQCLSSMVDTFSGLLQQGQFIGQYRMLVEQCSEMRVYQGAGHETRKDRETTMCFEHVSFHYPGSDRQILDDVCFTLKMGQSLSIVGANGAGKTTIVKLICRFYKPSEGRILLDGVDIWQMDEEEHRRMLGVVFQDFQLFAFSIMENVALVSSCEESRLWDALERSGLAEKVRGLEEKVNTLVSKEFDDCGIEFSGGEGQRLEFARVLYKGARIAIFDEPAASLDPVTEYEMYQAMHKLMEDRLGIFISHRLASTKFTDAILVLQEGHVIEYGSFEALMRCPDGVFHNMYVLQQQHYKK